MSKKDLSREKEDLMSNRPNILFLMTDHTNSQALAPGSQCITPNLDKLASEGRRFGRCYTTNAICSPARASLMTSLFPSTHGMWDCTHTQRAEWVDVPANRFTYFSQIGNTFLALVESTNFITLQMTHMNN